MQTKNRVAADAAWNELMAGDRAPARVLTTLTSEAAAEGLEQLIYLLQKPTEDFEWLWRYRDLNARAEILAVVQRVA